MYATSEESVNGDCVSTGGSRPAGRAVRPRTPGADLPACEGTPLVSFVIPVFDQLELTRRCLESIAGTVTVPHEVIIVDNGSTDGTGDFLEAERVTVISNGDNLGISKATSQGIAAARGEYVCLLNNDVVCLPGWLEPLISCLERDPDAGLAGPKQVTPDGLIWHAGTVFLPQRDSAYPGAPVHIFSGFPREDPAANNGGPYPAMNFGCAMVKARLFGEVGVLDDEGYAFPGYYEDVDWCLRARKAGYACYYCPESVVLHDGGRTSAGSGAELKDLCEESGRKNLLRLREKWGGEPEPFFVPQAFRPLIEQYLGSAVYLRQQKAGLEGELERARLHARELEQYVVKLEARVDELEAGAESVRENNAKAERYVRDLEVNWRGKCSEIEEARAQIASLEETIKRHRGGPR